MVNDVDEAKGREHVQVLALEPDSGPAGVLGQLFGLVQVRWPVHVAVQALPLLPELWVVHRSVVRLLELDQAVPERLRYILTSEVTKARWQKVLLHGLCRRPLLQART